MESEKYLNERGTYGIQIKACMHYAYCIHYEVNHQQQKLHRMS